MLYIPMNKNSEVYFVIGGSKEEIREKIQSKLKEGYIEHDTSSKELEEIMLKVREAEPCSECGMNSEMYYNWYGERGIPAGRAYQCISSKCGKHERLETDKEII